MRRPTASKTIRRSLIPRRIARRGGGCDVLEDPSKTGLEATVFWRADALTRGIWLVPAPRQHGFDSLIRFEPKRWGGRQAALSTPDGYSLIVAPMRGVEHRLFFADPEPPPIGTKLMPLLAFDAWHPERLEATLAFWRFAQNPRVSPARRVKPPQPSRKTLEAAFLVWALDLRRTRMSTREVARALFGLAPRDWEDSGFRSFVRRLLAKADSYAAGRYRELLKPRRRGT